MKIKKTVAAVALALGVAGAQAATYLAGTLSSTPYSGTHTISSSFSDIFEFTIAAPNNVGAAAFMDVKVGGDFGVPVIYDITGLTASLYAGWGSLGSSIYSVGPANSLNMSGPLTDGNYTIKITGTGVGAGGAGMYSYVLLAVPEPESYAMFLAGLGLMGMIARRRRGS